MKFRMLEIDNFRAIQHFKVDDLRHMVVIAGPNGSGKSCIFDAIRLLKSANGGYNSNEVMQWFGEFQVSLDQRANFRPLFRDPRKPISIRATLSFDESEKTYVESNAETLVEPVIWRDLLGQQYDDNRHARHALTALFAQYAEEFAARSRAMAARLRANAKLAEHHISLIIDTDGKLARDDHSLAVDVIFRTYEPEHLGIIDYYSANRSYAREAVAGLSLNIRAQDDQRMNQSLYNFESKYRNIKSELANGYLRELVQADAKGRVSQPYEEQGVAEAAETPDAQSAVPLNETLDELFQVFFPDKRYGGVQPDSNGDLAFPVLVAGGGRHDINDLSSGEKEVLYGYLRLRNSTPRHSVILLDEPELHLNPGLLRGFPDFYHKHIGIGRDNQIWLVTHSDTLLRQSVGNPNYSVYHMSAALTETSVTTNQAAPVEADDELNAAVIGLVGDLATYRPNAKVVIFEGGGTSQFDVSIVSRLFPRFAKSVNCVSGGNKLRVRDLYSTLADTAEAAGLADKFFAVTDRDYEILEKHARRPHELKWDRYHVENYLLEEQYIYKVVVAVSGERALGGVQAVEIALKEAAAATLPRIILERLRSEINTSIRKAVNLGAGMRDEDDVLDVLDRSLTGTFRRLDILRRELDSSVLEDRRRLVEKELRFALNSSSWKEEFPGRPVLKQFVHQQLNGRVSYDTFVNLVIEKMADVGHEPPGMKAVLEKIQPLHESGL